MGVYDGDARIRIGARGFNLVYGEDKNQSADEAMDAILTDELTNLLSSEDRINFRGTLETTDLKGLNPREINEVFSHGVRMATASILANDELDLTNVVLQERLYREIYLPTLEQFKMNTLYFGDGRSTQKGYQMSLEDFKRYCVIIKRTGPAIRVIK